MKAVTINVVGTAIAVLPVGQRHSMRAAPLSLHQLQRDHVTHLRLHLPQHPYTATQTPPCTLQHKHLSMLPYCNTNTTINAPILQHKHHLYTATKTPPHQCSQTTTKTPPYQWYHTTTKTSHYQWSHTAIQTPPYQWSRTAIQTPPIDGPTLQYKHHPINGPTLQYKHHLSMVPHCNTNTTYQWSHTAIQTPPYQWSHIAI